MPFDVFGSYGCSHTQVPQKKIPLDVDGRKKLLRSQPWKRGKGSSPEKIDFSMIIQEVLTKHRAGNTKAGSGGGGDSKTGGGSSGTAGAAESHGLKVITLEAQLKAFEGNLEDIPQEDERSNSSFFAAVKSTPKLEAVSADAAATSSNTKADASSNHVKSTSVVKKVLGPKKG